MRYLSLGLPGCDRLSPRSRVWNNADQQPEFAMRSLTVLVQIKEIVQVNWSRQTYAQPRTTQPFGVRTCPQLNAAYRPTATTRTIDPKSGSLASRYRPHTSAHQPSHEFIRLARGTRFWHYYKHCLSPLRQGDWATVVVRPLHSTLGHSWNRGQAAGGEFSRYNCA
jgi:hypothetical protein